MNIKVLKQKLQVQPSLLMTYLVIYFVWGIIMHNFGDFTKIARFTYWWQVITCYLCYMVSISLLLREKSWQDQYAYGVVAIGILEIFGYALGTSYAFDNNILDMIFGPRNFTLAMTIFFGSYFPIGNFIVSKAHQKLFVTSKSDDLQSI